MELADSYPEVRPAPEIAKRRSIPAAYLSRLLSDLARSGLVLTRRGPAGGVALARPPEKIPVASVLSEGCQPDTLPPAISRLSDIVSNAVRQSTADISIADLARWERQMSAAPDYSI